MLTPTTAACACTLQHQQDSPPVKLSMTHRTRPIPAPADRLACPAGDVLQRQLSNGRGIATSMGNRAAVGSRSLDLQSGLESTSSFGGASSGSTEDAQELTDRLWQVLVEGVQPFMQWELQSGMGDFWEQVCPQQLASTLCKLRLWPSCGQELCMLYMPA